MRKVRYILYISVFFLTITSVIILPKLFRKQPAAPLATDAPMESADPSDPVVPSEPVAHSDPGREAGENGTSTEQNDSAGAGSRRDTSDEVEAWAASVVKLEVYNDKGSLISTGSGFAALDEPVLVTACHVIVNMDHMIAIRDDGTSFEVKRVIAVNKEADVAVCVLPEDADLTPLPMAESPAGRGREVIAIGSQFGLTNLVTKGNVCGTWDSGDAEWILFTAPVSSGSSGGPLLNEEGEVLGIITGTYDKGQNLNLAAPMSVAYSVAGRRPATIGD